MPDESPINRDRRATTIENPLRSSRCSLLAFAELGAARCQHALAIMPFVLWEGNSLSDVVRVYEL